MEQEMKIGPIQVFLMTFGAIVLFWVVVVGAHPTKYGSVMVIAAVLAGVVAWKFAKESKNK
jgi:Flp pilus assembly protein TadB